LSTAKQQRHALIRQVLRDERIDTHESMAQALARRGIDVSQSTLSKDLRELGVVRVPQAEGGFRYWLGDGAAPVADRTVMERELRDYVTDLDRAEHMLVVKTLPGHAQVVSEAIDRMEWPEVMGTIAGENTIFVMSRSVAEATAAQQRLAVLAGHGG
jgi:transcriptional regulator of arginine metabolism